MHAPALYVGDGGTASIERPPCSGALYTDMAPVAGEPRGLAWPEDVGTPAVARVAGSRRMLCMWFRHDGGGQGVGRLSAA